MSDEQLVLVGVEIAQVHITELPAKMKVSFAILAILLFGAAAVKAQPLAGLWDATVVVNGVTIPFRMEFSGEGSEIKGSFPGRARAGVIFAGRNASIEQRTATRREPAFSSHLFYKRRVEP